MGNVSINGMSLSDLISKIREHDEVLKKLQQKQDTVEDKIRSKRDELKQSEINDYEKDKNIEHSVKPKVEVDDSVKYDRDLLEYVKSIPGLNEYLDRKYGIKIDEYLERLNNETDRDINRLVVAKNDEGLFATNIYTPEMGKQIKDWKPILELHKEEVSKEVKDEIEKFKREKDEEGLFVEDRGLYTGDVNHNESIIEKIKKLEENYDKEIDEKLDKVKTNTKNDINKSVDDLSFKVITNDEMETKLASLKVPDEVFVNIDMMSIGMANMPEDNNFGYI